MTADGLAITLHASAEETASGVSAAVDLQSDDIPLRRAALLKLSVSAVSDEITVAVQTSPDEASWETLASFTVADAVGSEELWFGDLERYVRISWTLAAAESATFAVDGEACQTFCTLPQLVALGGAEDILAGVTSVERVKHLEAVSSFARGYLAAAGQVPILGVGRDVARAVAQITVVDIITSDTGLHPEEGATELLLAAADRARQWLRDVAAGKAQADVTYTDPTTVDPPADLGTAAGVVYGDLPREWSNAMP